MYFYICVCVCACRRARTCYVRACVCMKERERKREREPCSVKREIKNNCESLLPRSMCVVRAGIPGLNPFAIAQASLGSIHVMIPSIVDPIWTLWIHNHVITCLTLRINEMHYAPPPFFPGHG